MKVVPIPEFVNYLKSNGLVIVRAEEFQANKQIELEALRARLLKKKAISVSDVVRSQLLRYKTEQGMRHWLQKNLKEGEHWYREKSGKKRIMILTEILKAYV